MYVLASVREALNSTRGMGIYPFARRRVTSRHGHQEHSHRLRLSMQRCPKASSRRVSLATPDSVVPFSNVISSIYQDVLSA
jgi:hypothetical protein